VAFDRAAAGTLEFFEVREREYLEWIKAMELEDGMTIDYMEAS
jgi:hypothetical protein